MSINILNLRNLKTPEFLRDAADDPLLATLYATVAIAMGLTYIFFMRYFLPNIGAALDADPVSADLAAATDAQRILVQAILSFDPVGNGAVAGMLASASVLVGAVAALFRWERRQTRVDKERLHARLRSDGQTPERAATLVGYYQALLASGFYRWQALAMTRAVAPDAAIGAAMLDRMPAAPVRNRRRDLTILALYAVGSLLIFHGSAFIIHQDWSLFMQTGGFACRTIAPPALALAFWWLTRREYRWKRDNLRRSLERCRDAGLDDHSAALMLAQTPALIGNDKKAAVALRGAAS